MMSRIEQLIGEIEEYIDSCKYQPLSNSKIVVNRDELEELLVELRLRIPDEIKQYQKIISNRDAILNESRQQADSILAQANAQTSELINELEIMQKAYAQAQQIVDQAVADANAIRESAVQYTDDMLKSLQTIISHSMEGAQGRFDAFMNSMQSSYDIVSSNRQELTGAVIPAPEGEGTVTEE